MDKLRMEMNRTEMEGKCTVQNSRGEAMERVEMEKHG